MRTGARQGTAPLEAALQARDQAGPGHQVEVVALLRTAEAGTGSRGLPEATTVMPRHYTTSEQLCRVIYCSIVLCIIFSYYTLLYTTL